MVVSTLALQRRHIIASCAFEVSMIRAADKRASVGKVQRSGDYLAWACTIDLRMANLVSPACGEGGAVPPLDGGRELELTFRWSCRGLLATGVVPGVHL